MGHLTHFIFWVIGSRNEAGAWYGFWSGFAGGLQVFEWMTLGVLVYVHHTCHDHLMCLRWGRYEAAGGLFKLCHHHHPDMKGHTGTRRELIEKLHRESR